MHVNQKSSAGHGKLSSFAGTIRTLRRLASPHALDNVIQRWDQPLTPNGNHNNMFNPGDRSLRKNTSQGADVPHDLRGIGCKGAAFVPRRRPAGPPPPQGFGKLDFGGSPTGFLGLVWTCLANRAAKESSFRAGEGQDSSGALCYLGGAALKRGNFCQLVILFIF